VPFPFNLNKNFSSYLAGTMKKRSGNESTRQRKPKHSFIHPFHRVYIGSTQKDDILTIRVRNGDFNESLFYMRYLIQHWELHKKLLACTSCSLSFSFYFPFSLSRSNSLLAYVFRNLKIDSRHHLLYQLNTYMYFQLSLYGFLDFHPKYCLRVIFH